MNKSVFTSILLLFLACVSFGQSPIGFWETIDDETGKPKSIVEIFEKDGQLFGRIDSLYPSPGKDPNRVCAVCPGDRKNQRIAGMEIIRNMVRDGEDLEWEDGTIMDPKSGKVYDCELELKPEHPNKLFVRGYILFIYRTQEWIKIEKQN